MEIACYSISQVEGHAAELSVGCYAPASMKSITRGEGNALVGYMAEYLVAKGQAVDAREGVWDDAACRDVFVTWMGHTRAQAEERDKAGEVAEANGRCDIIERFPVHLVSEVDNGK